jgi:hypothetical protein
MRSNANCFREPRTQTRTMLILFTALVMLIVGYAYFREGVLTAVAMTVNIFLAGLLAFNFYEPIAGELESMVNGTFLAGYEDTISLFLVFAASLAVLRLITMNLAHTEISLPALAQQITATLFGLISGFLLAGFLVCMLQTLPWSERFLAFEPGVDPSGPQLRRYLPPDRVWLAMMSRASTGPLKQGVPFDPEGTFTLRYARLRRTKEAPGG